jgi:hypothetical protein
MTDEQQRVERVVAKLKGEFYIGQRVKVSGCSGTVCDLYGYYVIVDLDLGRRRMCERDDVDPL